MAQNINSTGTIANFPIEPVTDTKGASKFTGLAENTLIVMRSRGDGPKYIKYARAVRYRIADLQDYVESRIRSHSSEAAS
jgi:predicted DNA-binding transcriptional regulator AlpA